VIGGWLWCPMTGAPTYLVSMVVVTLLTAWLTHGSAVSAVVVAVPFTAAWLFLRFSPGWLTDQSKAHR
jgi:hypothetical protein